MINLNSYKKYWKLIIPIFFLLFLIILFTFHIKNNDIIKLRNLSNEIIATNETLSSFSKDNTLNYEETCTILNKNLDSFEKIDSKINSINSSNKEFTALKKSLSQYNKLNINLCNSALAMLSNKDADSFSILYNDLLTSENSVLKSSSNLSTSKLNIYFPQNAHKFYVSLNQYINILYKESRDDDIQKTQKLNFILNMNNIIYDFSGLKEDLKPAINKIKEDNRSLSTILDDLTKKRYDFTKIKAKAFSISIPSNADYCYDSLKDMLNAYDTYLNSIEKSVQDDINTHNNNSTSSNFPSYKNITSNYDDSFDKYNTFLDYFSKFKESITDYKNN